MIRDAIRGSRALSKRTVEVFAHGSYRNNTTVRQESDVDLFVLCKDVFFSDFSFAEGFGRDDVGIADTDLTNAQFKDEVEEALVSKFGRTGVTRGNKAFGVHENTYRVDADVVACFGHRRYTVRDSAGVYRYLSGVEFVTDRSQHIINWPGQSYENGVRKNTSTGNRFKQIARVIKRLRNEMADAPVAGAAAIPGYLSECLVWNVPNDGFGHSEYAADVRYALAHTFNETLTDDKCKEWGEVNELKYLFRASQPWTRLQAHAFLEAAWDYVGFS